MKKRILIVILIILIGIQFIPALPADYQPQSGQTFLEVYDVPREVGAILKTTCYDCHSHQAKWPWYSKVAPLSFWIGHHVEEGREHLDFSQWGTYSIKKADHKLEEIIEEIKEGEMPMDSYTWLHSEARLSEAQKSLLLDYISSLRN
jgi:hypothetical protein